MEASKLPDEIQRANAADAGQLDGQIIEIDTDRCTKEMQFKPLGPSHRRAEIATV